MNSGSLESTLIMSFIGIFFLYLFCYHNGVGTIDIFNLKKDSNDED